MTFAIGCIAKLYNTTQIKDNQSLQNGGSKSCYDVVCHFVDHPTQMSKLFFYKMAFPISTKWGGTTLSSTKWLFQSLQNGEAQPFLLQNGFSNLYKMGRHNPCTTKNSPCKMALGQMNPSKNGRPGAFLRPLKSIKSLVYRGPELTHSVGEMGWGIEHPRNAQNGSVPSQLEGTAQESLRERAAAENCLAVGTPCDNHTNSKLKQGPPNIERQTIIQSIGSEAKRNTAATSDTPNTIQIGSSFIF